MSAKFFGGISRTLLPPLSMTWKLLETDIEISLSETLFSGQVFHFKQLSRTIFCGVLSSSSPVFLRQVGRHVYFLDSRSCTENLLYTFFNLDIETTLECGKPGLRFLTNDILPTIFSFICSSNNHISRITRMVQYLYTKGTPVALLEIEKQAVTAACAEDEPDSAPEIPQLYAFPSPGVLKQTEAELRDHGFGYRASYVSSAAAFLSENDFPWSTMTYSEARSTLMGIKGIGRKVADCICLIALRFFSVVPIDVHILRRTNVLFGTNIGSLTSKTYERIQEMWRERYGEQAGIAQLYAFKEGLDMYRRSRAAKR